MPITPLHGAPQMNPEDVTIETLCDIPVRELPTSAEQFIQKIEEFYDKVPPALAPSVKVMVDAVKRPGIDPVVSLVMTYERPLSDAEKDALALSRAKTLLEAEKQERALLQRLLIKYGEPE